ncbi:MAG: hypothetical protein ACFCUQ_10110 [Kiloniellales bacterium]
MSGLLAAPGRLALIERRVISAASAAIDFVDLPYSAFAGFILHASGVKNDGDATVYLRLRRAGQASFDAGTGHYKFATLLWSSAPAGPSNISATANHISLGSLGGLSNEAGALRAELWRPGYAAANKPVQYSWSAHDSGGHMRCNSGAGFTVAGVEAIDGMRITQDAGNIDEGHFDLFGVRA